MHKTYEVTRRSGPTKGSTQGRFFWEKSWQTEEKKGICFVPDYLIEDGGELKRLQYLSDGWARLNCGSQPEGRGSHMFPDLEKPVLEEKSIEKERIQAFLKGCN